MHVSGTDAVKTYDGVYNKQPSTINGYDWFVARNDVGDTNFGTNATIYFSTSHDRWVIEAPDVYWEANQTHYLHEGTAAPGSDDEEVADFNNADDRRRFHGLSAFFGENNWFQFSADSRIPDLEKGQIVQKTGILANGHLGTL